MNKIGKFLLNWVLPILLVYATGVAVVATEEPVLTWLGIGKSVKYEGATIDFGDFTYNPQLHCSAGSVTVTTTDSSLLVAKPNGGFGVIPSHSVSGRVVGTSRVGNDYHLPDTDYYVLDTDFGDLIILNGNECQSIEEAKLWDFYIQPDDGETTIYENVTIAEYGGYKFSAVGTNDLAVTPLPIPACDFIKDRNYWDCQLGDLLVHVTYLPAKQQ